MWGGGRVNWRKLSGKKGGGLERGADERFIKRKVKMM